MTLRYKSTWLPAINETVQGLTYVYLSYRIRYSQRVEKWFNPWQRTEPNLNRLAANSTSFLWYTQNAFSFWFWRFSEFSMFNLTEHEFNLAYNYLLHLTGGGFPKKLWSKPSFVPKRWLLVTKTQLSKPSIF